MKSNADFIKLNMKSLRCLYMMKMNETMQFIYSDIIPINIILTENDIMKFIHDATINYLTE